MTYTTLYTFSDTLRTLQNVFVAPYLQTTLTIGRIDAAVKRPSHESVQLQGAKKPTPKAALSGAGMRQSLLEAKDVEDPTLGRSFI